jgi:cytochrome oxidase assembly protein ShyY1
VRFLLSRRWLLFAVAVCLLAAVCVRLGEWQFDRLHQRQQRNEWTRSNIAADPVPVEDVMAVGASVEPEREWTRVVARGEYDADATVVVRYQTRHGDPGVDLVTPLVTAEGTAVLVDRGWVATENTGEVPDTLPAPPTGTVEVVGFVRADATGRGITVDDGSTRAVSSVEIGRTLGVPVLAGFLDAATEEPAPETEVVRPELPDLGEGPHFFYGLQWWFFGALALGGFGFLAYDERRRKRSPTPASDQPPESSLVRR